MPPAEIPRQTCKLFGAIKALATIKNSVILVHGPKGCVYHINYILGMRGDRPSKIYTTSLSEHEIIFGGEEQLKEAILYLDRTLHPELLFLLSCCCSEIIGEDLERAAREVQTRATVIAIPAGGFEGDFHEGYRDTLCRLVTVLAREPTTIDPRSVNLVGMLRAGPDLAELKSLLGTIGVTVNAVLTASAAKEELEAVSKAALNIVPCEAAGKEAAILLEKKFGTPYLIEEIPIGWQSTTRFLDRVAGALGLPGTVLPPAGHEKPPDCSFLKERRIAVISGPTRAVSLLRFFAEYGITPCLVIVDVDADVGEKIRSLGLSAGVLLIEPDHELIVTRLKEHRIDLLIGGMLEQPIADLLGIAHIDIMHGSRQTIGYAGAENLVRLLEKRCRES